MNKQLTGEMIYKTLSALVNTGNYCIDSDDVTPPESQIYADLAEKLNEQLRLVKTEQTTLQKSPVLMGILNKVKSAELEAEHKKTLIEGWIVTKFCASRYKGDKDGFLSIKDCLIIHAEDPDAKSVLFEGYALSRAEILALRDFLNDPETARIMGF